MLRERLSLYMVCYLPLLLCRLASLSSNTLHGELSIYVLPPKREYRIQLQPVQRISDRYLVLYHDRFLPQQWALYTRDEQLPQPDLKRKLHRQNMEQQSVSI